MQEFPRWEEQQGHAPVRKEEAQLRPRVLELAAAKQQRMVSYRPEAESQCG